MVMASFGIDDPRIHCNIAPSPHYKGIPATKHRGQGNPRSQEASNVGNPKNSSETRATGHNDCRSAIIVFSAFLGNSCEARATEHIDCRSVIIAFPVFSRKQLRSASDRKRGLSLARHRTFWDSFVFSLNSDPKIQKSALYKVIIIIRCMHADLLMGNRNGLLISSWKVPTVCRFPHGKSKLSDSQKVETVG